ncbi:LAMI_0H07800g1_1 [Lachancea mirantina]|uniref:DNA 3'-5' helicase n=1 Tax=Lachancea mirantina TaxID=1230905 RepID=A0A1G4KG60_9SACH|nr:LAMI_0H07800g1_1 [Lachancea mirantina]
MEGLLSSLNEKQKESVVFDHTQALQVVAGPGTGKTKVLTTRVAFLLLEKQISPGSIIITTFTKKATTEMYDRLTKVLEGTSINPNALWIGTFHSICARILRQHGWKVGLPKDWRTFSDSDTDPIVQKVIQNVPDQVRDYAYSYTRKVNLLRPTNKGNWEIHPNIVKRMISWLKSQATLVDEYKLQDDHDAALLHFYELYQAELTSQHALDFDDLLLHAFKLLSQQRCLPHIQHVLVDEFQDTSSIQLDLMYLFARGNSAQSRGITVVGDPDQSIYAFRNALARNFDDMSAKCPLPCSKIVLVENYRSSQRILTTSEKLIQQQQTGRENRLPLRAQFDCQFPPVYIEFPAKFLEATALAREIVYLRSLPDLWTYNDFALLVRHRRQIGPIEKALIGHRIPYRIVKGRAFWQLKEINGMMDLLKCVYSDYEKNAMTRALQYPARGAGPATITKIETIFPEYESPFEALEAILNEPQKYQFPSKIRSVISDFITLIKDCRTLCLNATDYTVLEEVFDKLYEGSGLRYEYLFVDGKKKTEVIASDKPNELNKKHLNIKVLREHLTTFQPSEEDLKHYHGPESASTDPSQPILNIHDVLREFINSVNLYSTETAIDESQMTEKELRAKKEREKDGFVTISTIHGAKGLEWPVVMIPGCVEGVIPCIFGGRDDADGSESDSDDSEAIKPTTNSPKKSKMKKNDTSVDEERRMFFVAQTRAKFLLYLTATNSSDAESRYDASVPSRFFTTDLVSTMCEDQKAFSSVDAINELYRCMNKIPPTKESFSFKTLVSDYKRFFEEHRERFIWKGTTVYDTTRLKFSENTDCGPAKFGITTASAQLRSISPQRNTTRLVTAPSFSRQNSADVARAVNEGSKSAAPVYRPSRMTSNCIRSTSRVFAPKTMPSASSSLTGKTFAPNKPKINVKREYSSSNNAIAKAPKSFITNTSETKVESTSPRRRQQSRARRTIVADSINLQDEEFEDCDSFSDTEPTETQSFKTEDSKNIMDKTAAELLHDPRNLTNDNRPILTNARTLAESIRSSSQRRSPGIQANTKKKPKLDASEGFDIMSRLSKAKRRADDAKDTVIVID